MHETGGLFHEELRTKQKELDSLHASLRLTSGQLGDVRRTVETMQDKLKKQHLTRQKVHALSRAHEEENYRVLQLEQANGRIDDGAAAWEAELDGAIETASSISNSQPGSSGSSPAAPQLPPATVLRARVNAIRARSAETRRAVAGLQSRSREVELKYRHLVALCTRRPDGEVDTLLDGLMRAVESEKGELEIARVRRFLGGVEGVAH